MESNTHNQVITAINSINKTQDCIIKELGKTVEDGNKHDKLAIIHEKIRELQNQYIEIKKEIFNLLEKNK